MYSYFETAEELIRKSIMLFHDVICTRRISSKSGCVVFAMLFYGSLLAISLLNVVVDPLGYFGTNLLTPTIQLTRDAKAEGIRKVLPGTSLILGSSRVLKIEPAYLSRVTDENFYNAGVNYGKPEDFYALLQHYQAIHRVLPRKIILGLDVVAFNAQLKVENELLSSRTLSRYLPKYTAQQSNTIFNQLLGFQKTKLSIACIRKFLAGTVPADIQTFRDDGVIVYQSREVQLESSMYDFQSALYCTIDEYRHHFRSYSEICPDRWKLFVETVEILRLNGCEVFVFLTPDHPELQKSLLCVANYQARTSELHARLTELSRDSGIKYSNLQSIEDFHGDETAFVDGIHPLEKNTQRLVRAILQAENQEDADAVQ